MACCLVASLVDSAPYFSHRQSPNRDGTVALEGRCHRRSRVRHSWCKGSTRTVPIIMIVVAYPVGQGLVASLAEELTKFELVMNQRTAKVLGITIPQSIPVRADR